MRKEEVHRAHRLQQRKNGKPPTIIVQFFSRDTRDKWLGAGKKAKLRDVFFNENMCQFYRQLFYDTKDKANMYNYKYVWFQGGKILVRKKEGDRQVFVVKGYDDLKKLQC